MHDILQNIIISRIGFIYRKEVHWTFMIVKHPLLIIAVQNSSKQYNSAKQSFKLYPSVPQAIMTQDYQPQNIYNIYIIYNLQKVSPPHPPPWMILLHVEIKTHYART